LTCRGEKGGAKKSRVQHLGERGGGGLTKWSPAKSKGVQFIPRDVEGGQRNEYFFCGREKKKEESETALGGGDSSKKNM